MYVIFLRCTHCVEKTLIFSCTLLCESGDRVMVGQSSFSAYLHAVMLGHHCSEYANGHDRLVPCPNVGQASTNRDVRLYLGGFGYALLRLLWVNPLYVIVVN